jgi:hypothetical protein
MQPVREFDAILLLALAVASKRRPAQLVEIVAAADMLDGEMPTSFKMSDAVFRLSKHGLIAETEAGFTLTPAAEAIITGQRCKTETEARVLYVNERLEAYEPAAGAAPAETIALTTEQLGAAILAHRAFKATTRKSWAMPKSRADEINYQRTNKWRPGRKPAAAAKSKAK